MLPSALSRSPSLPNIAAASLPVSPPGLARSGSVPNGLNLAVGSDSPGLVPLDAVATVPYGDGDFEAVVVPAADGAEAAAAAALDIYRPEMQGLRYASLQLPCTKPIWQQLQRIRTRFAEAAARPDNAGRAIHFVYETGELRQVDMCASYDAEKQAFLFKDVCYADRHSIDSGSLFSSNFTVDEDSGELLFEQFILLKDGQSLPEGLTTPDAKHARQILDGCSTALESTHRRSSDPTAFGFLPRNVYPPVWKRSLP